jgi:hypothetical protein
MTKEDFIAGVEFEIVGNFFKKEDNTITKVYRSREDRSIVVMEDYHMNVEKIGRVGFEAFTYMLGKKVVRKIKFNDLEVFKGI